jgi:hypothetical protein
MQSKNLSNNSVIIFIKNGRTWIFYTMVLLISMFFLISCNYQTPAQLYATSTTTLTPSSTATITETSTITQTSSPVPTETITITFSPEPSLTSSPSETPTITDTITPGPSPTNTRTPTNTRPPTRTLVPSRTRTNTFTPTVTNTPTPPAPVLKLDKPGPYSKISSPIEVEAAVSPGEDGLVFFTLTGEDGRLITQQVENYSKYIGRQIWIAPDIAFNISAVAETARLSVFTHDLQGRFVAINSVDVILMMVGKDELNPSVINQEPYIIRYPRSDQVIQGGILTLTGLARPVNDTPLLIELIAENGNIVGNTQVIVPEPTGSLSHTPFAVEIPYTVSEPTIVRLTIRQESDNRIPGTVALSSMLVQIEP